MGAMQVYLPMLCGFCGVKSRPEVMTRDCSSLDPPKETNQTAEMAREGRPPRPTSFDSANSVVDGADNTFELL